MIYRQHALHRLVHHVAFQTRFNFVCCDLLAIRLSVFLPCVGKSYSLSLSLHFRQLSWPSRYADALALSWALTAMFRSRSTTRLFQSWRGSQAAAFRSRRFGDSSTRNARSSGTTTRLAASKALPLLIGAGLAYLGYATFIQDGRVVREVFAEPAPSKWDGTESMRERLRTAMKDCGALDPYALESNSRMSAENKKLEAVSKLTVQGALRADTCQLPSNR